MRFFTLFMPVVFAANLMTAALYWDGPAYRAITPGWDQPFRAACNENKAICRKLEIENGGSFGIAKVVVISTPPGKEAAGIKMLDALLAPTLRPGVSIKAKKER